MNTTIVARQGSPLAEPLDAAVVEGLEGEHLRGRRDGGVELPRQPPYLPLQGRAIVSGKS